MPLPDPTPELKLQLAAEIDVATRHDATGAAAVRLGVGAARVSDLRAGRLERFSVERLIRMLAHANRRVTINVVHPIPARLQRVIQLRRD